MKLDIVAGGCPENEKWDLHRKRCHGNGDQRPPELNRRPLRIGTIERRTDGRFTQTRIPMKDSTHASAKLPQSTFNPDRLGLKTAQSRKSNWSAGGSRRVRSRNWRERQVTRRKPSLPDCADAAIPRENLPAAAPRHGGATRPADLPSRPHYWLAYPPAQTA